MEESKSPYIDADHVDSDLLNDLQPIHEIDDVKITMLTVEEKLHPNSVTVGPRLFRAGYIVNCQNDTWNFCEKASNLTDMFTYWGVELFDAVKELYGNEFDSLLAQIDEDDIRIHECGGITLTLTRGGVDTKVAMRAATLEGEVSL